MTGTDEGRGWETRESRRKAAEGEEGEMRKGKGGEGTALWAVMGEISGGKGKS